MTRTTLAAACSLAAALTLTACGTDSPASAPATSTPSTTPAAVAEATYVSEVTDQRPDLAMSRAELVAAGRNTCATLRKVPGNVAELVQSAASSGETPAQVSLLTVVAIAAVHNLCPDQSADL